MPVRFSNSCALACLAGSLFLGSTFPGASFASAEERVALPLEQRVLSDGNIRYFVYISIGGSKPIAAMVDTGSTGLRILPDTLPDSAFTSISGNPDIYGYGSGVRLSGVAAEARLGLGGLNSAEPVPLQLVRKVDCFPAQPKCPASRISEADYRIGGDGLPKEGFEAILGIAFAAGQQSGNPLPPLGAKKWIVVLPRPGEKRPGELILNPGEEEAAGYTFFLVAGGQEGWKKGVVYHDGIPGCIVVEKNRKRICGPTLLDTGAPGIIIHASKPEDSRSWERGDRIGILFTNRQGGEVRAGFEAGKGTPSKIQISAPKNEKQTETKIASGTLPYFLFSVLYDSERNLIGLKRR
jgi:hypothetical protein